MVEKQATYLVNTLKSKYCIAVFVFSMVLSYFLIPSHVFYSWYTALALLFMVLFSLTLTCIVRNIKERIVLAKTYKSSLVGIIAIGLGLGALQVCGFGAPVCGAAVGFGVLSFIFPAAFEHVFSEYAVDILVLSIAFQFIALYFMNCFKKCGSAKHAVETR